MKTFSLTAKEQKLFNFIENYQSEHGASPTVKEMRQHMRLKSDGFVVYCLKKLAEKGAIEKDDTPRGIKLLSSVAQRLHQDFVKLPVLGSIPAGGPFESREHVEDWFSLPAEALKNAKDCFILRVRGDSMIDAGIFEGDYIIASTKKTPRQGDIVIALVDGGSTVKRYMTEEDGKPYLQAENKNYKNIHPELGLEIQGVVVGLFRWY